MNSEQAILPQDREMAKRFIAESDGDFDELSALFARHREAERNAIVAWLRSDARLCDCFAREENECHCGAWDDYKIKPVNDVADDIAANQHHEGETASD